MPESVQGVHHIDEADLVDCGLSFREVWQQLGFVFSYVDVLLAYNAAFDVAFMLNECSRHALAGGLYGMPVVDVLELVRIIAPGLGDKSFDELQRQ